MSLLLFNSTSATAWTLMRTPHCQALTEAVQTASPGPHSPLQRQQSWPLSVHSGVTPTATLETNFLLFWVKADVLPAPTAECSWQQNSGLEEWCWVGEQSCLLVSIRTWWEDTSSEGQPSLHACIPFTAKETQSPGWGGQCWSCTASCATGKLLPLNWRGCNTPSHLQLCFSSYQTQAVLTDPGNVNWLTIPNLTVRNFPMIPKPPPTAYSLVEYCKHIASCLILTSNCSSTYKFHSLSLQLFSSLSTTKCFYFSGEKTHFVVYIPLTLVVTGDSQFTHISESRLLWLEATKSLHLLWDFCTPLIISWWARSHSGFSCFLL